MTIEDAIVESIITAKDNFEKNIDDLINIFISKLEESKNKLKTEPTCSCPNITIHNKDLPEVFKNYPKKYEGELVVLKLDSNFSKSTFICIGSYDLEERCWHISDFYFKDQICLLDASIHQVIEIAPLPFGF